MVLDSKTRKMRLYIVCDTKEELAERMNHYEKTVRVLNKEGESMLLKGFDVEKALELK